MLWGSRNKLSIFRSDNGQTDLLQASCILCRSRNGLSKLLQASYTLCGSQNGLTELLQAKTDPPNIYKVPSHFVFLKPVIIGHSYTETKPHTYCVHWKEGGVHCIWWLKNGTRSLIHACAGSQFSQARNVKEPCRCSESRFVFRNAYRRLVPYRRVCFDFHNLCRRLLEVWGDCFDFQKVCRRLVEVWSHFTNPKSEESL